MPSCLIKPKTLISFRSMIIGQSSSSSDDWSSSSRQQRSREKDDEDLRPRTPTRPNIPNHEDSGLFPGKSSSPSQHGSGIDPIIALLTLPRLRRILDALQRVPPLPMPSFSMDADVEEEDMASSPLGAWLSHRRRDLLHPSAARILRSRFAVLLLSSAAFAWCVAALAHGNALPLHVARIMIMLPSLLLAAWTVTGFYRLETLRIELDKADRDKGFKRTGDEDNSDEEYGALDYDVGVGTAAASSRPLPARDQRRDGEASLLPRAARIVLKALFASLPLLAACFALYLVSLVVLGLVPFVTAPIASLLASCYVFGLHLFATQAVLSSRTSRRLDASLRRPS